MVTYGFRVAHYTTYSILSTRYLFPLDIGGMLRLQQCSNPAYIRRARQRHSAVKNAAGVPVYSSTQRYTA